MKVTAVVSGVFLVCGVLFAQVPMKTVKAGEFTFTYAVDGPNLIGKVSYPTPGWVAIGFNPTKVMKNATMIIGAVIDSQGVVTEEYGTGMFDHRPFAEIGLKDVLVSRSCTRENGVTTLSFTMPLESTDGKHVSLKAGNKVKVIFAESSSTSLAKKHKKYAVLNIKL